PGLGGHALRQRVGDGVHAQLAAAIHGAAGIHGLHIGPQRGGGLAGDDTLHTKHSFWSMKSLHFSIVPHPAPKANCFSQRIHARTSLASGSPRSKARAFSMVVMAMLCSAVRVKNA